jgi:molecular chaperone DnaK
MSKIVGIDFGTTKTVAAIFEDKYPTVIPDRKGRKSIPSVVLVSDNQEFFVGWEAREHHGRYKNEYISINSIKRDLGRHRDKAWGWLKAHPPAVAALILGRLKIELENHFQSEVRKAVIAIPAHFDINQRWAVMQAAQVAGFEVWRMVNEAAAAAIAYAAKRKPRDQTILVLDFGGGTLDASILEIGEDVCEVKATAGDGFLGGDDFDLLIVDRILEDVRKHVPRFKDWSPLQNAVVIEAAVNAKKELSAAQSTQIRLPGLVETPAGSYYSVDMVLDRTTFERLSQPLLTRTENVLNQVLKDACVKTVDEVLLIGGTSRIPAVREVVRKVMGRAPFTGVDPLTCVAEGAAVLGGVLSGKQTEFLFLDVYPNSLSVSGEGGRVIRLIARNTTIPTRKSEIFSTSRDNQTRVDVPVYEGEYTMAAYNSLMGSVTLFGIPAAPAGKAQIEVTFDIDHQGLLNVSAKDKSTGRSATATMNAPSRLTDEQLKVVRGIVAMEMKKTRENLASEAEKEKEDKGKKEALDFIGMAQILLTEYGERVLVERVSTMRSGFALVRDYLERETTVDDLHNLVSPLRRELDKILGSNVARHVKQIFEDQRLAPWADAAAASLDGHKSLVESMKDFEVQFGQPHVDSVQADLRRASSKAHVCDSADAELQHSIGARYCLWLVISYFADHVPLALDAILPSEGEHEAEPLLTLLLYSELSRDKSAQRRAAAATFFSKICQLRQLIPLLGHNVDEADKKLHERLQKASSADLYAYFRSISPEKRGAYFSLQQSRERLRGALLDLLHVKDMEEKKFILLNLSGLADHTCTQPLLDTLAVPDVDDEVRCLVINLLPTLRDSRVIKPLLKLFAGASSLVQEEAQSALDRCSDLMNEEWARTLSTQEWFEYYSVAPIPIKHKWVSNTAVRRTSRTALCEALPEKTVVEQMSILEDLGAMADAESVSDYIKLLARLDEAEPCSRLISVLSTLRDKRAVEPLIKLLSDERPEVRKAAGTAFDSCKDLLDPDTKRFIKITKRVMEFGWPPSIPDRFFISRYVKRHRELIGVLDGLKRRRPS